MSNAFSDSLAKESVADSTAENLYTKLLNMPWVRRAIEGDTIELSKGIPSTLRTQSSTFTLPGGKLGVFLYPTIRLVKGKLKHFENTEDAVQYAVDNNDLFLIGTAFDTTEVKKLENKSTELSKQLSEYIALRKHLK